MKENKVFTYRLGVMNLAFSSISEETNSLKTPPPAISNAHQSLPTYKNINYLLVSQVLSLLLLDYMHINNMEHFLAALQNSWGRGEPIQLLISHHVSLLKIVRLIPDPYYLTIFCAINQKQCWGVLLPISYRNIYLATILTAHEGPRPTKSFYPKKGKLGQPLKLQTMGKK